MYSYPRTMQPDRCTPSWITDSHYQRPCSCSHAKPETHHQASFSSFLQLSCILGPMGPSPTNSLFTSFSSRSRTDHGRSRATRLISLPRSYSSLGPYPRSNPSHAGSTTSIAPPLVQ
jgi:hypothetical protein